MKGHLNSEETLDGPHSVSSCCVPTLVHFSSLQPPGPSQTRACSERVEGGAFLHVQALGRQAPAQASVVLGPPNPGVRQDGKQSSVPFDASLAAAPEGSGLGPRERTLGEKQHFSSCVCLCESVYCRLGRGGSLVPDPPGLTPGEDAACVSSGSVLGWQILTDWPHHRCHADLPEGTGRGKPHSLPQTPTLTGVRTDQGVRPWVKHLPFTGAGQAWRW